MFYRETDGRRVITQHCALAGFVASHFMIPFYSMSVGILQQCLGGFSKPDPSIRPLHLSVLLLPWKCPLVGKVYKDWSTRLCLSHSCHSPTVTTVASASSLLLENIRV